MCQGKCLESQGIPLTAKAFLSAKVVKLFRKYWWCPTIILTWELLGITMELLGMLGIGGTRWGHVWDTFGTRLGCLMLRVVGRMLRVQGLVSRWKYKFKS